MRVGQEIEKKVELRTTPFPGVKEDMMFVALGKDVKESDNVLMWALHNSRGMRICILHVHQPAQKTTMMGGIVSISLMEEHLLKAHHESERQEMHKTLDKYIWICDQAGVRAAKLCIEMDSIEKGIVQLISEHGIKWLVMGAAANISYSLKMKEPKSKKAIHVQKEAPNFCHIWFICKGNLIHTRVKSDTHGMQLLAPNPEGDSDCDSLSKRSHSVSSHLSTCSSSEIEDSASLPFRITEGNKMESELPMSQQNDEDHRRPSVASDVIEQNVNDELYDRLEQFVAEAGSSRKEVYEESVRVVIDAIRKSKASETMYAEELKGRRNFEEALARGKEEVEKMKMQLGEIMEEVRVAQEQKSSLESQIADSDKMVEDLEQKMFAAVELLHKYKKERDELEVQCDNALRVAEDLREKQAEEASSSSVSHLSSDFSFLEIEEATGNFSEALKVGEEGYGSIYRGCLRHTQVAIKMLHPNSLQGPFEFQHEANILSKLRHPNIITLMGACPESWALVCEYLPNGSLEDRLNCKNNTPPLSWKTRLRIASEQCSALVFLHSCRPEGIVHGNLKPANILLDANFVSKLKDFGICRELRKDEFSENNTKGTFVYTDPEFLVTGEFTSKSDVYSFGIILLRLLTGKPALGITREVQYALDNGILKDLLDPTGGDWPFVQAKQLAHLGVGCSDMNRRGRPDLASEVWRVLENMKVSCGVSCLGLGSEEGNQTPAYFVCPIFQEIMQDPVAAADGYTYESEALKGWLESHDTSPMTNLKLPHRDFVPNHALRSAIQEWLQKT